MDQNGRAALLMTGAMAMFAIEDAFIKRLGAGMPVWQILAVIGLLAGAVFWFRLYRRGLALWSRAGLHPMVVTRTMGEIVGAVCFVTALSLGDLSTTTAILQVLPLSIVLGAALVLGERVGWRRWLSIIVGFLGVLLILQPGTDAFDDSLLWAVVGVAGLTVRDLATRRVPAAIASDLLSASAYLAMVPAGLILALLTQNAPVVPGPVQIGLLAGTACVGVAAYAMLVTATRLGEASVVAPFRYTRLGFALLIAVLFFGERPDLPVLLGAGLIAISGGYSMWREARSGRARRLPPSGLVRRGEP